MTGKAAMTTRITFPRLLVAGLLFVSPQLHADVGDPTLRTEHPQYAGEGAFQTVEDCVEFASAGKTEPQERALAVYNWLLTHQFHLYSPQEWNVPGAIPGAKLDDYEMVVYDANRGRFSYGYGLCGTVHAWNEPYWRALGMDARRRAFPGHVNSEIHYAGSWHAFDTDMAGLLFRPDGVVAGYDDIRRDLNIVRTNDRGVVCYPFAWPGDFNTMKQGWQEVAKGGNWYSMYNSGYCALPGVVHLRRGETFTRHWDRDVFGGPDKRRFWHVQKDGPFRNWTFVNMGQPTHRDNQSNCRGNASYANAVFRYQPDLNSDSWRDGVVEISSNLVRRPGKPGVTSADSEPVRVTFEHFSPYVICGDPVDDTNPMSGGATEGMVVSGAVDGKFTLEISVDQGQSWVDVSPGSGEFTADFTEQAKGRNGWWLRFTLSPGATLRNVTFDTTCQVNQAMYPRLTANGCDVSYRAASRAVVAVKPNFGLAEPAATRHEVRSLRSPNIQYTPRTVKQVSAYTATTNKPAEAVFQVESPTELVEVAAAARYRVRSPQPEGCDFRLDLSIDEGKTWTNLGRAHNAADNEYSSGWVYGRSPINARNVTRALVRVHLDGGGYPTSLIDFEAYGLRRTTAPPQAEVTWAWRTPSSKEVQHHRHAIAAGAGADQWTVPTPGALTDAWVEIKVP